MTYNVFGGTLNLLNPILEFRHGNHKIFPNCSRIYPILF